MKYKPQKCKEYKGQPLKGDWIAEEKLDGYRACLEISPQGTRIFLSRDEHEVTHLLPELAKITLPNTYVLDGELLSPTGEFKHLPGLCGARTLESTAEKNRKKYGHPIFVAYDCLEYATEDITWETFEERRDSLVSILYELSEYPLIRAVEQEESGDYPALAKEYMTQGKEGIIIKNLDAPYECDKKVDTQYKIKGKRTLDVVVMGFQEPTKEYTGKSREWKYWENILDYSKHEIKMEVKEYFNMQPVTKPYFKGYVGAIEFGVYREGRLVKVGECRGFSDEVCEFIKNNNCVGMVIEVTAQDFIDKNIGSLRHPRFSRWRDDKKAEECTWEAYIGE